MHAWCGHKAEWRSVWLELRRPRGWTCWGPSCGWEGSLQGLTDCAQCVGHLLGELENFWWVLAKEGDGVVDCFERKGQLQLLGWEWSMGQPDQRWGSGVGMWLWPVCRTAVDIGQWAGRGHGPLRYSFKARIMGFADGLVWSSETERGVGVTKAWGLGR